MHKYKDWKHFDESMKHAQHLAELRQFIKHFYDKELNIKQTCELIEKLQQTLIDIK